MSAAKSLPPEQESKRAPERTCVGCGTAGRSEEMLRYVLGPDGQLVTDLAGRLAGRGAWVHATEPCLQKACQRGFARSFHQAVSSSFEELLSQLTALSLRRVEGLLLSGARRRFVVHGREPVAEVVSRVRLALLAEDARALARDTMVQNLGLSGKLVVYGEKERLGALFNRAEVGIVAVLDHGIAQAVLKTISIARLGTQASRGAGDSRRLAEVR